MIRVFVIGLVILSLFSVGCKKDKDKETELPTVDIDIHDYARQHFPNATPTESGMYVIIQKEGSGARPQRDQLLHVYYMGSLLNGVIFDSTKVRPDDSQLPANNRIFKFKFETGSVIAGWHEGFGHLNIGSKAVFLIPPDLGYGAVQTGRIPKNSVLRFDVELLDIK